MQSNKWHSLITVKLCHTKIKQIQNSADTAKH